jgi:tetratricopeptide (TPR) repeat protein
MPTVLQWPSVLRTRSLFLFLFLATNCSNASAQSSALNQSTQALYRGDYAKASSLATAHLRRFPNDAPVRVILARAEFAQAEFLQAFVDLRKALASDPKNIDALYYLSLTARELAQRESQRLFSMAPDSDLVHQLLGEAALTANHQSEAEEEFQKALKANPRSIEVLTELAELERSQRKLTEAITYYTQAEELDPLNYNLAYGLGVCYTYTQEYPRAIEWLQKAVTLAPDSADGRFALGRALFHNEQFAAALPELQAALRTEPRMKEAFALLGRAYLKLGRSQEAKAALQRFDELSRAESQNAEARPDAATPPKQ